MSKIEKTDTKKLEGQTLQYVITKRQAVQNQVKVRQKCPKSQSEKDRQTKRQRDRLRKARLQKDRVQKDRKTDWQKINALKASLKLNIWFF